MAFRDAKFLNMAAKLTELITTTAFLTHQMYITRVQINKEQLGDLLVPHALIGTLNVPTTLIM
jgi:D-aminopeptidase